MDIKIIDKTDGLWERTIEYALKCPWKAGPYLAKEMKADKFNDWERVIIVIEQGNIMGFCTISKTDIIPNVTYSPYIGYVYIDELFRVNRVSEKMIKQAMAYIKYIGLDKVYLVSDQVNLYEKYGFVQIDEKKDYWG